MLQRFTIVVLVMILVSASASCNQHSKNNQYGMKFSIGAAASTPNDRLKVGPIKDPFILGCGCYLKLPDDFKQENDSDIFETDLDESAQMNIDGKDIILKLVRREDPKGKTKVGSTRSEVYASGNIEVRVEYIVKKICNPKDEDCEDTVYSANITITRNGIERKIRALGPCGC